MDLEHEEASTEYATSISSHLSSIEQRQQNLQQWLQDIDSESSQLSPLTDKSRHYLTNLVQYTVPAQSGHGAIEQFPTRLLAGVLILLNILKDGSLGVTLTTRSLKLRAHPGDTALPGGKYEVGDRTIEYTALREANEEINLPIPRDLDGLSHDEESHLMHLTTLAPFASASLLIVFPVVYLYTARTDSSVIPGLEPNPEEVEHIFNVPIEAFLPLPVAVGVDSPVTDQQGSTESPSAKVPIPPFQPELEPNGDDLHQVSESSLEVLLPNGSSNGDEKVVLEYSFIDIPWLDHRLYRLRAFDSPLFPSKISGLTADILLALVRIVSPRPAMNRSSTLEPDGAEDWFELAENQMGWNELVQRALVESGRTRKGRATRPPPPPPPPTTTTTTTTRRGKRSPGENERSTRGPGASQVAPGLAQVGDESASASASAYTRTTSQAIGSKKLKPPTVY